ncbi:hypothetical protein KUTeg_003879 [Tegillarca granosa]|uniref:Uncharacterized protein n=1 Tax=Tegillarca granosa TaxID=220873 RepID=A0ABQ9FNF7_TEGGR|nr:hypothetical protein KUTeg_003879 [Tegillarca granosa]
MMKRTSKQHALIMKVRIVNSTILVGDSGVGKTSLLVQFDQGKFQAGSFSATVGIGFTSTHRNDVQPMQSYAFELKS